MTRYVLYDEEKGIYLGNAMGLGFWSKWDPVGQIAAVTFSSPEEATQHRDSWEVGTACEPRPVEVREPPMGHTGAVFASVEECVAAGLPAWSPDGVPEFDSGDSASNLGSEEWER